RLKILRDVSIDFRNGISPNREWLIVQVHPRPAQTRRTLRPGWQSASRLVVELDAIGIDRRDAATLRNPGVSAPIGNDTEAGPLLEYSAHVHSCELFQLRAEHEVTEADLHIVGHLSEEGIFTPESLLFGHDGIQLRNEPPEHDGRHDIVAFGDGH